MEEDSDTTQLCLLFANKTEADILLRERLHEASEARSSMQASFCAQLLYATALPRLLCSGRSAATQSGRGSTSPRKLWQRPRGQAASGCMWLPLAAARDTQYCLALLSVSHLQRYKHKLRVWYTVDQSPGDSWHFSIGHITKELVQVGCTCCVVVVVVCLLVYVSVWAWGCGMGRVLQLCMATTLVPRLCCCCEQ